MPIIHALLEEKIDLVTGEWTEPQVVICSPTRELAQQIFNEARKFAFGSIIKIAIAYGGTAMFYQASQISVSIFYMLCLNIVSPCTYNHLFVIKCIFFFLFNIIFVVCLILKKI